MLILIELEIAADGHQTFSNQNGKARHISHMLGVLTKTQSLFLALYVHATLVVFTHGLHVVAMFCSVTGQRVSIPSSLKFSMSQGNLPSLDQVAQ
jgi:hypothetical protein